MRELIPIDGSREGKGVAVVLLVVVVKMHRDEAVFEKTVALINDFKAYFVRYGQTVYENPSPGNKEGGITTLEEKSLGAIVKGGSRPIVEVIDYADEPTKRGLVIMNTPSAACESMTSLLGGGSHIILFSTGRGNAIGAPVAPTVKITGNPNTAEAMSENIDVDVSSIITEGQTREAAAGKLWTEVVKVASGKMTRCEILREDQLSVSRFGPSV